MHSTSIEKGSLSKEPQHGEGPQIDLSQKVNPPPKKKKTLWGCPLASLSTNTARSQSPIPSPAQSPTLSSRFGYVCRAQGYNERSHERPLPARLFPTWVLQSFVHSPCKEASTCSCQVSSLQGTQEKKLFPFVSLEEPKKWRRQMLPGSHPCQNIVVSCQGIWFLDSIPTPEDQERRHKLPQGFEIWVPVFGGTPFCA